MSAAKTQTGIKRGTGHTLHKRLTLDHANVMGNVRQATDDNDLPQPMIEWEDSAVILSARPHGEQATIVNVLSAQHGRYAGLLPGGQTPRWQPLLQPGNPVRARWRARLPEHLGHYQFEGAGAGAARWLSEPWVLAVIDSACSVAEKALPERQPQPLIYDGMCHLLLLEDADLFGAAYVQWELGLLAALGYGLDLSVCAVTQRAEDLFYVSPRTGRAVSRAAGTAYHDKLLPLPGFLRGELDWSPAAVRQGLQLTAHFLARRVFHLTASRHAADWHDCLPAARRRLMEASGAAITASQAA